MGLRTGGLVWFNIKSSKKKHKIKQVTVVRKGQLRPVNLKEMSMKERKAACTSECAVHVYVSACMCVYECLCLVK